MNTVSSWIAIAAVVTAPLGAAAAQAPDGAIERAVAAWAKVRTLRGTFEQTVTNSLTGTSAKSKGEYVQERPNRMAIRFAAPMTDAIIADGKVVWVYLPSSAPGQVTKRPATDRSAVPIDLAGEFLDAPRTKYDITPAAARTVDGHQARGFVLVPKKGVAAPFTKATVWIDEDDSLIREFEIDEPSGVIRHIHLTSVEVNAPVDRKAFNFPIPKGVKIVDQTKP
ncbi:MAG TPA: outer membrane lipoprotein carrier protein LolA [Gemmatimonadaceae bacterium]